MSENGVIGTEKNVNRIYSVNGPVVKVRDTKDFQMMEMVYVGKKRLIGEVIGVSTDFTTIQVYEGTSGLMPGEPVESTGVRFRHWNRRCV